jgi:glycosyltransferase involved in cell wall biosynthesis
MRGMLGEALDAVAVRALARLPATRRTWRRATVRIVQNEATLAALPPELRSATRVLNHATLIEVPTLRRRSPGRRFLSVGPLERRKGVALAIRALASAPEDIGLVIVGNGPRRLALERLAARLGLAHRVDFLGQVSREEVFRLCESAAGAVFTGLREEGGLALAEAMLLGLPVIVLAHGGARTIAAQALDASRVALIAPASARLVARHIGEAMGRMCEYSTQQTSPNIDGGASLRLLYGAVEEALAQKRARTASFS